MLKQGVEDVKGKTAVTNQTPKIRMLSKVELREQAEAALRAWRAGQSSEYK